MNSKTKNIVVAVISVILNIAVALGVIWAVSRSGVLIKGSDSMYHIYRGCRLVLYVGIKIDNILT